MAMVMGEGRVKPDRQWCVYIDESGDLGFDFTRKQTSKHLTIAAVATQDPVGIKRLVRSTRERAGLSARDELKGGVTTERIQALLLDGLSRLPIRIRAFTIYRPNVYETLWRDRNIFYNYCAGKALTPLLKECADAVLYWDARQVRTGARLAVDAYIKYKLWVQERAHTRLQIHHVDSKAVARVQVADLVAHAIFVAWEREDCTLYRRIAKCVTANDRWFRDRVDETPE
jgi:tetrahydromethanopterin S-methyltransferase subunit F